MPDDTPKAMWHPPFPYPITGPVLNFWILVIVAVYCISLYGIKISRNELIAYGKFIWDMVSNAFSFAISICLILGFVDHNIVVLLGDLSSFLAIFGIVGFCYTLHFLFKSHDVRAPTGRIS